ncbi:MULTISPECIES: KinB-signaling pathway activation protein [Cohnella]|uniref:KinB-signaling pathway activation protein n=1 Tax=Cohnella TaxID=329857 RepID=UPI001593B0DC|nr:MULTISPECIES: KinB-signaling pathway activation protein [Cohnella]MBN2980463.1 KinB-signaling pathway activation protein [Cohnella algarum]
MNLRKWMSLFGMSILIGSAAAVVVGGALQLMDLEFRDVGTKGWLYNLFMMAIAGLSFGAFSHMGFFAYLMLNYISRSVFKRPYLWVAAQAFITLFVLAEIAFWTYDSEFPAATFWLLPILLTGAAAAVAWRKAQETTAGAWIPTMFFMIAVTAVEALPSFRSGNIASLVFYMIPLFVCNTYQILKLHRILGAPAQAANTTTQAG